VSRRDAARLSAAAGLAIAGIGSNYVALALSERWVRNFPTVPDVLVDRLGFLDLYVVGEIYVVTLVVLFLVMFLRVRAGAFAFLLAQVGMLYAIRGMFLLMLPLGPPAGAPPAAERFSAYPSPHHAYFPSGHMGLLVLLSLMAPARAQPWFWSATALYAVGAMLAKAHYTADLIAAAIFAYAVHAFGTRWLEQRLMVGSAKQGGAGDPRSSKAAAGRIR